MIHFISLKKSESTSDVMRNTFGKISSNWRKMKLSIFLKKITYSICKHTNRTDEILMLLRPRSNGGGDSITFTAITIFYNSTVLF
uniref:Putative ovule protein n=1 Tax=Solanum chacoense TaxID=4108 RepID=A0A0V0HQT7_SOLCH